MSKPTIELISAERLGDSDDVWVSGTVDGRAYLVHVWYSHLYGDHADACLQGDKKAIRAYLEEQLLNAATADQQVTALAL
jgi:hypothetical protein